MSEIFRDGKFIDHLEALRRTLLKIFLCLVLLFPVGFYFAGQAVEWLIKYSCPPGFTLHYFSPLEPLVVQIKIGFFLALFAGVPYIAVTVWKFVSPGLYRRERRSVALLAVTSWLLFAAGTVFCLTLIIPLMIKFSLSLGSDYIRPAIGIGNFTSMATMLLAGFGLMFQFPIVVFMLVGSGLVSLQTFRKQRAIVLITILVLSAILTPPDIISQVLMATPTYLLFEISLLMGSIAIRKKDIQPEDQTEEEEPETVIVETSSPPPEVDDGYEDIYASARKPARRKIRARRK